MWCLSPSKMLEYLNQVKTYIYIPNFGRLATRIRRMWQRSHLLSRRLSLSFRMCSVRLLRETSTLGMDWGSASSQLPALNTGSSPSDETNDNYHATNHYFSSLIVIIVILVRLLINVSHLCLYISTIVIETMWPFLLYICTYNIWGQEANSYKTMLHGKIGYILVWLQQF